MKKQPTEKFVHDVAPQSVYDHFNSFIFSEDRKLLGKLQSKQFFCGLTKEVPGDVVELGVFKGSGMIAWIKTLGFHDPAGKQVIGFDAFDHKALVETINTSDKSVMNDLFEKRGFNNKGYEVVLTKMLEDIGYGPDKYKIVAGNIMATLKTFLDANPGFRASIINFDLDLEEPTEYALNMLWSRVPKGGVLIFDEYGLHEWTESNAVDRFVEKNNLTLKRTPYAAPTAYIVK